MLAKNSRLCKRCVVSGLVQGVFYRASTAKQAAVIGVTGWVRNLPDGCVEAKICGEAAAVEKMIQWLWNGPARARVDDVAEHDAEFEEFADFTVQ